ncbi:hypothetical protein GCM10011316_30500 [Roseibium aquae]|uniref:Uncharacterized protein n=1 Tax=Roseibium aquae TaxID=1323746 RepID=A0A916TM92_9HYPH|nr:hypothetical protein [Roseibium aquae]GGB56289.1 hypothetical protein GCM10011316_30500 [Roseibium aquae]
MGHPFRLGLVRILAGFGILGASLGIVPAPAEATVIYCTGGPGVPKGCVVRPTATVIYCTRPGFPAGCVVRPAAGPVVVAPGAPAATSTPTNRNGGVNRLGVRR